MNALLMRADCADLLMREGLADFGDFFRFAAGQVISEHHARNVTRFEVGELKGYLKREHFIPWKEYLQNWWAGFGFVSKSQREWRTLQALAACGLRCPEPLAVGEQEGKAFLLVRDIPDAQDLGNFLAEHALAQKDRVWLAHLLGKTISDLHAAGFTHPDLYAKHVFVDVTGRGIAFIDFQRTRRRRRIGWRERWRDLAALNATLREALVSSRERLHCLFAYLRHTHLAEARRRGQALCEPMPRREWRQLVRQALAGIERRTRVLLGRRRIQRQRNAGLPRPEAIVVDYWRVAVHADGLSAQTGLAAKATAAARHSRGGA